jgi:hypothetical protein
MRDIERSLHRGSEYCCSSYPIPVREPPWKKEGRRRKEEGGRMKEEG